MAMSNLLKMLGIFLLGTLFVCNVLCAPAKPIILSEDNWEQMLSGEWMVEFFAPWCPACKALQPVWDDFSSWSQDLRIKIAKVDVTTAPGLSGRFMVTALPTIFHVINGEFRQYRGGRDKDSLMSFVEEKKWGDIEPIPSWKSPGSFGMSVMSYFFKLSTVLRSIHNKLTDEYAIPVWGSYALFGVSTVLFGAILGLILVCFIDCIYAPKTIRQSNLAPVEEEGDDAEDLIDEGAESASGAESDGGEDDGSQVEDASQDSQAESEKQASEESSPVMRKRKPRKAD